MDMLFSCKTLILFLLSLFLLFCDAVQGIRRYKVCNGLRCQSVRSFISPEFLFDIDGFMYTSWSRWSPCTRLCATQRYRACRFPSICGERMMIYEEAFCFRRGSHCEEIFHRNNNPSYRQPNSDDMDYLDRSSSSSSFGDSSSSSSVSNERSTEHRRPYADRLSSSSSSGGSITEYAMNDTRPAGRNRSVNGIFPGSAHQATTPSFPSYTNSSARGNTRRESIRSSNSGRNKSKRHHKNNEKIGHKDDDGDNDVCGVARMTETPPQGLMLRILGGQEARKGRWPWQVAILNRMQEAFCGGTLIAPRWILTAAHCVRRRIHVTIGEHHLHRNEGTERHYRIDAAFIHPDFDPETVNNDIALLLLPEPVSVQTGVACLPEQRQTLPAPDTLCTILGWGKERHNHVFGTTVLHEGKVPIVNSAECRFTYPYEITNNMFCAGYKGGTVDSCAGDSGGPILCSVNSRWTVFGVTSFGDGCGRRGKYGIYAKVPNYVEWIYKVIQANEVRR